MFSVQHPLPLCYQFHTSDSHTLVAATHRSLGLHEWSFSNASHYSNWHYQLRTV